MLITHTKRMEMLRNSYRYIKDRYHLLSSKKYTTIAGTLVFFLIMSIMPLSFWLSLLLGKLPIDTERLLSLPFFDSVKNVLLRVREEAKNATSGASVFLIITTLYSSTNLFYQMRKSGEIIYDYSKQRKAWHLRLGALFLLLIVITAVVAIVLLFAFGSFLFSYFFAGRWKIIADYLLLALLFFFLVLLLNMYVCPYKTKVKLFLRGTLVTVLLWLVGVVGFSLYLRIGNLSRLYGALSAVIIFLLWLYILMLCFVIGVIINSERVILYRKKQLAHRIKKR
jgi:membrane protein